MKIELQPMTVETPVQAVALLNELTGLSKSRIKDAMTKGAVWRETNGRSRRLRRARTELEPGDRLSMYYDSRILDTVPEPPECIEDAGHFSVWIKSGGLMSGGSRFGDHCAINRLVEKQLDRPTFLVHRLDRFVQGVMVLAHARQAAADLSSQFEERRVDKRYRAVVHGEIKAPVRIDEPVDGKPALSVVSCLDSEPGYSLVEIAIETGRKHQIRKHLCSLGHPIVGDRLYGSDSEQNIQLAAVSLTFTPPGSDVPRTFTAPSRVHPGLPGDPGQEAK